MVYKGAQGNFPHDGTVLQIEYRGDFSVVCIYQKLTNLYKLWKLIE